MNIFELPEYQLSFDFFFYLNLSDTLSHFMYCREEVLGTVQAN